MGGKSGSGSRRLGGRKETQLQEPPDHALGRSRGGVIAFNLIFGAIDLYQAVAGLTGWFPAQLFALRPADHVVHVVIGLFLVGLGYLGKKSG